MKGRIFPVLLLFTTTVIIASTLTGWMKRPAGTDPEEIYRSVNKSLMLLQNTGYRFMQKGHCVSCHQNILTSMAVEKAAKKGIPVIDSFSRQRTASMEAGIKFIYNLNLVNEFIGAKFIGPYMLLGLHAEKYPASEATDMVVDYLLGQARPDGSFGAEAMRVPLESGEIHLAALAVQAIKIYAPVSKMIRVNQVINNTKRYLEEADPSNQQEIAFQLMGLQWTNGSEEKKSAVAKKLMSLQHSDGGWSQLPALSSDSYATGQALCALYESGLLKADDEVYQKGIRYLLKTQDEDGAWVVETRASPIQPFFSCGFPPYDENQFISAAGSNWAVMALLNALPYPASQ